MSIKGKITLYYKTGSGTKKIMKSRYSFYHRTGTPPDLGVIPPSEIEFGFPSPRQFFDTLYLSVAKSRK
jgi:hypothetical protein